MARLLIVGGSLGGLMAANVLLRRGHDVRVLEKSRGSLDGRGAGIVTHSRLVDALEAAGIPRDESLGVRVDSRVALARDGSLQARSEYSQVVTSWSRLYHLLLAALPAERYLHGKEVIATSQRAAEPSGTGAIGRGQGGTEVEVRCADGTTFSADLVIASDGIRSAVRAQWLPDSVVRYAGYVAWRGVCDEAVLSKWTQDSLFPHFGFGMPDGEQMLGYPVAGPGNSVAYGQRRYNFVWYRPAPPDGHLRELMTDADGEYHPRGIAPGRIDWRQVGRMRRDAVHLLAPQWAEILQKTAQPFLQPIYDLDSAQIAFGRVALMGDAAFVARPHVGMGVTKAGEDALALADAIATHGASEAAPQAYQAQRLPAGRAVVERGRHLGAYLEAASAMAAGTPLGSRSAGQAAGASRVSADASGNQRDCMRVLQQTAIDLARQHPT